MIKKEEIRLTTLSTGAGWACKIGPGDLSEILGNLKQYQDDSVVLGYESSDDSAAFRLSNGNTLIQTVDFFTPIVDDPYDFGQIAAANSLSDIYAMGGTPLFALNIVAFPIDELPKITLNKILQGGIDKAKEAGISIIGGHSIKDKEPKYGLVITGEIDESRIWKNSQAQPNDLILMTKKLGTGIIATAIKKGNVDTRSISDAIQSMKTLNKDTANQLKDFKVNAVTDISGFGLLGHLKELCDASKVSAEINFSTLKFFPKVFELANSNNIPGGSHRNFQYLKKYTEFSPDINEVDKLLVSDAQTSGGLLISMAPDEAHRFIENSNVEISIIGKIKRRKKRLIQLLR